MIHSRRSRSWLPGTVVFLALVASGCANDADDDDPADSSSTTASASSSATPSEDAAAASEPSPTEADPQARKTVKAAVMGLLRANTGHFELVVPFGDGLVIRETGRYRITPPAFEAVRAQSSSEGSITVRYRGVGDDLWYRLEAVSSGQRDQPGWPCWVRYDDMAALPDAPVELAQGLAGQPPAALIAASWGMGTQRTGNDAFDGTTDLATALGLLGTKFLLATGVDPQGDAVVPASFTLDEQVLSGFEVMLADLPGAIEAAGGSLPTELDGLESSSGSVTSRFTAVGDAVDVPSPPVDERLEFRDAEDFEAAMESCGNR